MSRQLGRISGPLLNANLLREGTDLRFENQLLYLDVTSKTLSINSTPINKELFVNGTLRTDYIIIDAPKINVGNLEVGPNNLIKATSGTVILDAADYVLANEVQTLNLSITNNVISSITADSQIEFRPTGTLEVYSNTNVYGNLHSTGDITAEGNIVIGSDDSDSVVIAAEVNSDIIPDQDMVYSLGDPLKKWNNLYAKNYFGTLINTGTLVYSGLNTALRPGKTWFVSTNGLDTNVGNHENGTYLTIQKALSVAVNGDTIFIYPGTYTETFPLTVPTGVTIKGLSLRSVIIQPTAGTNTNNAFLLNGETTVSDLTVSEFYEGYAFSFAPGAKITTRSPYVQNCSVITSTFTGTAPLPIPIFYSVANGDFGSGYGYNTSPFDQLIVDQPSGALATYITSTSQVGDQITLSGGTTGTVTITLAGEWGAYGLGYRVLIEEALSGPIDFTEITIIAAETEIPAGKGALVDGSVVDPTSTSASMLFHSCTFITPNVDALTMTNGVRVEWLNSFTYFANRSLYATQGTIGITQGYTSTWDTNEIVGATFVSPSESVLGFDNRYFSDADELAISSTPIGTVFTVVYYPSSTTDTLIQTGEWITIGGTTVQCAVSGITAPVQSNYRLLTATVGLGGSKKYGAEVRAIASASVYGNYGAVADGADTSMHLVQYNFGYIGAGLDSSNDTTLVIQANETVELNGGKVYYQSVDQIGNYRVGDQFYIDYDKGTTSIDLTSGNITGATGLVIGVGDNKTIIDDLKIDTGDFVLRNNDILTKSQDFNFSSQTGQVNLNTNVQIDKNLSVDGDVTVGGVLTVGNQTSDTVSFTADVASDLLPDDNDTQDLGSTALRWNHVYLQKAYVGNITLESNQVRPTNLNDNLILASLNAKVTTTTSDLVLGQNLTILGHGYLANTAIIGDVIHTGNYLFNQPQVIAGDRLISEDNQILVTEDGNVLVLEDRYLNLGTTGQITRIGNTFITGNIRARSGGQIGNINFLGRTISSATITLAHATAAESIVVADLTIKNNTISSPLTIDISNRYLKLSGDNGVVIPVGDSTTREPNPEIGQFRINSETSEGEVYSGNPSLGDNGWIPAKGVIGEASEEQVEESLNIWSLVLG